jgi:hypothetical protein
MTGGGRVGGLRFFGKLQYDKIKRQLIAKSQEIKKR